MTHTRRAIALYIVLLMSSVLMMLVLALFVSTRGGLLTSINHQRSLTGQYVAEAGLADVLDWMESNGLNSPPSPFRGSLSNGGNYTIRFASAAPGPYDSVNNLQNGGSPADTYRGTGTLAPFCALVVVEAQYQGSRSLIEAVVSRGGAGFHLTNALQAEGTIDMKGDLVVDGIKAIDDPTPVAGSIYSNSGSGSAAVWDGSGTANVTGAVSAVGTVNLAAYLPSGGVHSGAAPAPMPSINIPSTIASQSGSPPPTINPTGVTALSSGDYYHNGDLTLSGDLELGGANLYVNGKLTVDGSVSGQGSVYVAGETSVHGDAVIDGDSSKIALFSQGNVTLKGFDGTAYLDTLAAADPAGLGDLWSRSKTAMQRMNVIMNSATGVADIQQSTGVYGAEHDALLASLGHMGGSYAPADIQYLDRIVTALAAQPDSSSKRFVTARLTALADFFSFGTFVGDDATALANYAASGGKDVRSLMDAVADTQNAALFPALVSLTNQINFARPGSARFVGLVYTHGNLDVREELQVMGGVVAGGNITLASGSRLTYVEEFFTNPAAFASAGSNLWVETWMGR